LEEGADHEPGREVDPVGGRHGGDAGEHDWDVDVAPF
jgi:hypothetical protein